MNRPFIMQPETAYVFVGGFYLAMSVLHFILYMYNRHRKANLIYSAGMMIAFVNFAFVPISTDPRFTANSYNLNILLATLSNGALLYFISYYIVNYAVPKYRNGIRIFGQYYLFGFITLLVLIYAGRSIDLVDLILRSSLYLVVAAACVIGLVRKIPNFNLIVIATVLLVITDMIAGDVFNIWIDSHYPNARIIAVIVGYTAPFVAYSTYLSKDLALTSKKLMKEHINNEKLTREKYEQEFVTRKILEAQNVELERSVFERTREISQQKEELSAQADKIQEIDRIKSQFFANISHEFRTPLTLIQGPVKRRLMESTDPRDIREFTIIYENSNRLLQLVNQLLDLSKLESGTLMLRLAETDLSQKLVAQTEAFHSLAEVKMIKFSCRKSELPIYGYVDNEKFEKIINNLLSNAFKFTLEGGSVDVSISKGPASKSFPEGYAEIRIVDSGIGISKDYLHKIFERFYQVDNSHTRQFEGSGIGLAITREFIELHKGEISVISEPGIGTAFHIKFPLGTVAFEGCDHIEFIESEIAVERIPKTADLSATKADFHIRPQYEESILIVEDNDDLRHYLVENLNDTYNILEAANGATGLDIAIKEVPDLIVSDLMMPKLDGLEMTQQLKLDERINHIPIILLTSKVDIASRLEGLGIGADDYISKPFDMDELKLRIRNIIQLRKKMQEKFANKILLKPKELDVQSADERFIQRIMNIVEEHISDPGFGVEVFAREAGMSTAQLYRKVSALTGRTPNDAIREMRLQRAAELFSKKVGNVADVAYQVGFNNLSYFAKVFKERFGQSPAEYLKSPLNLEQY